jgi:hypothetical protein
MRRCALALSLLVLGLGTLGHSRPSGADEADVRRETQLKSGYLLNFVKFVEWPPTTPDAPLTLCFLGGAGMRETLESGIEKQRALCGGEVGVNPGRLARAATADADRE